MSRIVELKSERAIDNAQMGRRRILSAFAGTAAAIITGAAGRASAAGLGSAPSEAKLNWSLLTKKRASSTQGVPPGKEALSWVTNTVTLICGEQDAVLVDTFLSEQQLHISLMVSIDFARS